MITTLKHTISTASTALSISDMNSSLSTVTKYAWLTAGALFVCYLYFVGAITFSVIKQEGLAERIKTTVSETGKEELKYLTLQKTLTKQSAYEAGFVSASTIAYTAPAGSFAWNQNVRR